MRCVEKGCPFPALRDGFCRGHWSLRFDSRNDLSALLRLARHVDFSEEPEKRHPSTGKAERRAANTESKWGWLFAAVENREEFRFMAADHGIIASALDANRIRSVLNQNKRTQMLKWSVVTDKGQIIIRGFR